MNPSHFQPEFQPAIELSAHKVSLVCDHTFLNRSEAYRGLAQKGQSPIRIHQEAFESFLNSTCEGTFTPYAICIRPEDCGYALQKIRHSDKKQIRIVSVVGFPDGSRYSSAFKLAETQLAIDAGAVEIDAVLNVDAWKKGDISFVTKEIKSLCEAVHTRGAILKLIVETCELTHDEIVRVCQLADSLSVDFVKTSTGFSHTGAQVETVRLMRENFTRGIKLSGGVSLSNYQELLLAASGGSSIEFNPIKVRIGESSLLSQLASLSHASTPLRID